MREPWSSGYGRRLVFKRSWVRIPALYTGWTFFTFIYCKNCIVCLKKTENKRKRGRDWLIFISCDDRVSHDCFTFVVIIIKLICVIIFWKNWSPVANLIKHFTIANYYSRVVWLGNCPCYDSRVVNYDRKVLYKIASWASEHTDQSTTTNACGQSYKASTSVNYNSRVVFTSKLLLFTTLEMQITIIGTF